MSFTANTKDRVCISISPAHLQAVDGIAEQLERSRSWIIARALDSFLAPQGGEPESGAAVGAQDVAGLVAPRNAAPGPSFSGAAPLSESVEKQMATYSTTPEAAPAVRATLGLHADSLRRVAEQSSRVSTDQKQVSDNVNRRNAEYLTGKTAA